MISEQDFPLDTETFVDLLIDPNDQLRDVASSHISYHSNSMIKTLTGETDQQTRDKQISNFQFGNNNYNFYTPTTNKKVLTLTLPINETHSQTIDDGNLIDSGHWDESVGGGDDSRTEIENRILTEDLTLRYDDWPSDHLDRESYEQFLSIESGRYDPDMEISFMDIDVSSTIDTKRHASISSDTTISMSAGEEVNQINEDHDDAIVGLIDDVTHSSEMNIVHCDETSNSRTKETIGNGQREATRGRSCPVDETKADLIAQNTNENSYSNPTPDVNKTKKPTTKKKHSYQSKSRQLELEQQYQDQLELRDFLAAKIRILQSKCVRLRGLLNSMIKSSPDFVLEATTVLSGTDSSLFIKEK